MEEEIDYERFNDELEPEVQEEDETYGDEDCTNQGYSSDYVGYVNSFL